MSSKQQYIALMRHITEENELEYFYANQDFFQLSPMFDSQEKARAWYTDMMKDNPYV
jgi:hypothetical protein